MFIHGISESLNQDKDNKTMQFIILHRFCYDA